MNPVIEAMNIAPPNVVKLTQMWPPSVALIRGPLRAPLPPDNADSVGFSHLGGEYFDSGPFAVSTIGRGYRVRQFAVKDGAPRPPLWEGRAV